MNEIGSKKSNSTRFGIRESKLVRNTLAVLAGSGIRLALQGIYFVLLARTLGVEQYGAFVGVVALVSILTPFAPLGRGQLLIRNVARDPATFRRSWGAGLCTTGVVGAILIIVVLLFAKYFLPQHISLLLVSLVAVSDLLLAAVVGIAAQAFQAVEQLHHTAQIWVVLTGIRALSALVLIIVVRHSNALAWGFFYCLSSAVAAGYALFLVNSKLGSPRLALRDMHSDLIDGFYFSISLSSQSIYNDIDKTMLARLSTFGAVGIYAAAYRIVDLSFQPVGALLSSTFAGFFRHGQNGVLGTTRLAKRFLPWVSVYAVVAVVVLIFAAPALPVILGREFNASISALRWLSCLVALKAMHYFLSDCLTGAGFQGVRSGIQVFVAVLNVLLNLWLIPAYSWRGAAWASIVSDGALALGVLIAVVLLYRREIRFAARYSVEPKTV